jgi:predicted nucleic acid-binding protein
VFITAVVRDELLPDDATLPDTRRLRRTLTEGWIEVVEPPQDDWKPLNPGIDPSEASTTRTARRWRDAGDDVLLLIDDRAVRWEARHQGVALIGTAAVIGLARTQGLIPAGRPLLERLAQSGYFLGPAVIDAVLAEAGE